MKKAITTILSALLLISCLTVNVFATNSEGEDSGNMSASQKSSSETNEEYQATQYSENVESMNLVIPSSDDNNIIVPLTKRAVDENNSSYEWYISPELEMFTQRNYLDFCKSIANKEQNFYLQYTPVNGETQTVQSTDISISEPGNSNDMKRTSTVFETTVVFAENTKQNLLYARSVYFDNGEIKYNSYTPTSQDGPINIEIYNNQRYILYYGNDYDLNASTDDIVLNRSTDGISIGTNENFNINVTENNVFEVSSTHAGSSVSVSYADQTLTFTSVLPNVGVYTSAERSDSTYCTSYSDNNRVFYINWNNNFVSSISLNAIRRNNNYTYESNEYKTTLMENANSLKIEFNEGINIEGGLEIQLTVNPRNGNAYSYNPRINYEAGDTLYARNTYYGENNEIKYNEHAETSFNGDIFVDIYNNQKYALFFGNNYGNSTSPESERIYSVTISENSGMTITQTDGLLSVYSEHSGSHATITHNGKSLTFRSRLPEVGIYTSNVIADETYCAKYNSNRREFYINWDNSQINSVSIVNVSGYGPDTTYNNTTDYVVIPGSSSLKLSFVNGVDITKGGLSIKLSVNNKQGQINEFNVGCQYDSQYIENADYIVRDGQIYYKKTENNRDFYLSREAYNKFNSIKNSIDLKNAGNKAIIVRLFNTDNSEITNNIFFDYGSYFKIEKTVSLEAFAVSNPVNDVLNNNNRLSFSNPVDLDIKYRDTSLDYAKHNVYLFTVSDGIYNNSYSQVYPGNSSSHPFNKNNEYLWFSENNGNSSYVTIHSTFDTTVIFGRRLSKSDFDGIKFSQQNATVSTITELQNKIDSQFTVAGSTLILEKSENPIVLTKDLRLTNYADANMFYVTSNITNGSLLIDLNGNTLNLGEHKIVVTDYSTVHISNGTIIGSGDSLFDIYGGLSLHNVTCTNTNSDLNSYVVNVYRGIVFLDVDSSLAGKNGIRLADSHYYGDFDNGCFVSGVIDADINGVVFEEKETFNQDSLNVFVPNYINNDIENTFTMLNNINPSIVAGNAAIATSNKTNIMIAGTSYYEDKGNNTIVEHLAKAIVSGGKAISVKSGELRIDGNVDIISNAADGSNIEVVSSGLSNDDNLNVNINVSQKTNFTSSWKLIKETGTASRNISLSISCQEHINDSKFIYTDKDPFLFNSTNVSKNITAGLYSTNGISSYIDTNEYKLVSTNNGLYEVKSNSNDPYDYDFVWDDSQSDLNNLNNLEYYLTNLGTKNVRINSFKNASGTSKTITLTQSKNISINNNQTLNEVKLVIDANGKEIHINNGMISNQNDSCLVVENGKVYTNSQLITSKGLETIKVTGGELHFDPGASATGPIALNIEATDKIPTVDICGDLTGTSGTAIKYYINDELDVDYNNDSLYIVGNSVTNRLTTINGGIIVENGKVVTMSTEINANVAFELKGNSQLVIDDETVIKANNTAVFLNGSGTLFFTKGVIEAPYPVKVLGDNTNEYQIVFKDGVHCRMTDSNARAINIVNNNGVIQSEVEINNYNFYCEFAYFNKPVDQTQFRNLNQLVKEGSQRGMYTCVQFDNLSAQYPYCVAYKLYSVKHNSLHLNFTNNEGINIDSTKLDGLKVNQNDNEWTLLVLEEAEIMNKPDNMVDAYEIQVRNVKNDNSVTLISETSDYQMITIPVNPKDIEKIYITHKHGDEEPVQLRKITQEEALLNPKECYFVNDNSTSISIITKRFSQFGILQNDRDILPFAPEVNSPIAADITYKQKLSDSALTEGWSWEKPDLAPSVGTHTFNVYKTINDSNKYNYSEIEGYDANKNIIVRSVEITVDKAKPKYTVPTGLSATYGDKLSSVTLPDGWSWVNSDASVGNATTTGNKFKAIFTPSDTDNYNTVSVELSVIVKKAEIDIKSLTIPSFTGVEKGTLLSELKFTESGWNWVNPKDTVSDSNYAVYNPNKNNYVDLLVTVPVYVKETVAGKDVSISNTVKTDEKLEDIKVENNNITESVLNIIKNEKSDTVVTGDAKEFISSSGNGSLTISTELVKNEVTESAKNEALEKAEVKAENVAMVLDFKINIKVTKGSETKSGTITELAEPVKLTVKLPEGSKTTASEGKELKYYVLVIHGDDVLKIPATLNADGTVTFEADKFSTYILVSEEVDKPASGNNNSVYVPSGNKKPVVNTAAK